MDGRHSIVWNLSGSINSYVKVLDAYPAGDEASQRQAAWQSFLWRETRAVKYFLDDTKAPCHVMLRVCH